MAYFGMTGSTADLNCFNTLVQKYLSGIIRAYATNCLVARNIVWKRKQIEPDHLAFNEEFHDSYMFDEL